MQGAIIFYEQGRGIIRGLDQQRYDFTFSDWQTNGPVTIGAMVNFIPAGNLASQITALDTVTPLTNGQPQNQSFFSGYDTEPTPPPLIHNVPATLAALLLLISLPPAYARLAFMNYQLTDAGLGVTYYGVALALLAALAYGVSWTLACGGVVVALVCSAMALLGSGSLYADINHAGRVMQAGSDVLGELGMNQLGESMQQVRPSFFGAVVPAFYLHVASLLGLLYFVFIHPYRERTQPVSLPAVDLSPPVELSAVIQHVTVLPVAGYQSPPVKPVANSVSPFDAAQPLPFPNSPPPTNSTFGSAITLPVPDKAQTGLFVQSFLRFDKLIAPTLITIAYFIGLIICLGWGITLVITGLFSDGYGRGSRLLTGLGLLLIAPIILRLWAEFTIVIFNIHTRLKRLDDKTNAA